MTAADTTEDRVATLHSLLNDAAKKVGEQRERIKVLEAEIARLSEPQWFYCTDDPEYSYGDVNDAVDDMGNEGVMRVGGAREVWRRWAAVRCVEVDSAGDVGDVEVETFDTEAEALLCWPESLAKARAAIADELVEVGEGK